MKGLVSVSPDNLVELRARADGGDVVAQCHVGHLLIWGCGFGFACATLPLSAVLYLEKAGAQGDAVAQMSFAKCLLNGFHCNTDVVRADKLTLEATQRVEERANRGDVLALMILARHNYDKHNFKLAAERAKKVSDQNFVPGHFLLGLCLLNGYGVEKDESAGMVLMVKAATQGFMEAMFIAGKNYRNGVGVVKNIFKAVAWLTLVRERGHLEAEKELESILAGTLSVSIHSAAKSNNGDLVLQLIAEGADVNSRDEQGDTPLILAAAAGHAHNVLALLAAKANPKLKNNAGKSAVDVAEGVFVQTLLKQPPQAQSHCPVVKWSDVEVKKQIGKGGFGTVHEGMWNGSIVAIKRIKAHESHSAKREIDVLWRCRSPYVVTLFCTSDIGTDEIALIVEHMDNGSLFSVLDNATIKLPWSPSRWQIAVDFMSGMAYLHSIGVLHRDVKSGNVLLDKSFRAKICDFGMSAIRLDTGTAAYESLVKNTGVSRWQAPETFGPHKYRTKCDVFSSAVVLWEIASRKLPHSDARTDDDVKVWVRDEGHRDKIPNDCPALFSKVITAGWNKDSDERPTSATMLEELKKGQELAGAVDFAKASRSWHIDRDTQIEAHKTWIQGDTYKLVEASPFDVGRIMDFYLRAPSHGFDIVRVHTIVSPTTDKGFEACLKQLQSRAGNPKFEAKFQGIAGERIKQRQDLLGLSRPFVDADYPNVQLLPMWHGTRPAAVDSIIKAGPANLATTDSGFFGKGIYNTMEAEYAHRVYGKEGTLLLNFVAFYSAYPVVTRTDMNEVLGKANKDNFDAHWVLVVPANSHNADEVKFYPAEGRSHKYTELVVFNSAQCMPRFVVQLQKVGVGKPVGSGVKDFLGTPLLGGMSLHAACKTVFESYLRKAYTLDTVSEDWKYSFGSSTVERPNHGLAHTVRTMAYLPLCVRLVLKHNTFSPQDEHELLVAIPAMQCALLFYVVGRENEANSFNDAEAYNQFRAASADAFLTFAHNLIDGNILKLCCDAVKTRDHAGHWIQILITMAHDIDLLRCLSSAHIDDCYNRFLPFVGGTGIAVIRNFALDFVRSTGDRITGVNGCNRPYRKQLFVDCSTNVDFCIKSVQEVYARFYGTI